MLTWTHNFQYSMLSLSLPPDHTAPTGGQKRGASVCAAARPHQGRPRLPSAASRAEGSWSAQAANFYCTSAPLHSYFKGGGAGDPIDRLISVFSPLPDISLPPFLSSSLLLFTASTRHGGKMPHLYPGVCVCVCAQSTPHDAAPPHVKSLIDTSPYADSEDRAQI